MRFEEKLKKEDKKQIWQEYCGFLDIGLDRYMYIQTSLMNEQIDLWTNSPLGQRMLNKKKLTSIDELRLRMPLTSYADYADDLLQRHGDVLSATPVVWIQTTWEGGLRPIKLAPYNRSMLNTYRHNLISAMLMASAREHGDVNVRKGDRILYGGAPLPYATGLMPSLFSEDIDFTWLPDNENTLEESFSKRIKKGFSLALKEGVDYFFGIGSVAAYITDKFGESGHGASSHMHDISIGNALRYLKGKYVCSRDNRSIEPGDIFNLKALFLAGTDAACWKERIAKAWGIRTTELAAGTESTIIGAEPWDHKGMVFFPDSCFYEFIPIEEMKRNRMQPDYQPRTLLMDEVREGSDYELVISVLHGGAFMRYRIGDMYRCLSSGRGTLPRFTYLDRVPGIIDVAGFTRITEKSMKEAISLSRLKTGDWLLKKDFKKTGEPYLQMYLEIPPDVQMTEVTQKELLTEHLSLYFRYFDSDYGDLKKMLNMEPLNITILKYGTIREYEIKTGRKLTRIDPDPLDLAEMLKDRNGFYTDTDHVPSGERTSER